LGYEKSTNIARQALISGRNVIDIIKEEGLLDDSKIASIMKPENLTGPSPLISEDANKDEQQDKVSLPELADSKKHLRNKSHQLVDMSFTHLRNTSTIPLDSIFGPDAGELLLDHALPTGSPKSGRFGKATSARKLLVSPKLGGSSRKSHS